MTSSVIRRLVPAVAAALVLLSACSGGSDDDASSSPSTATPTPTTSSTPAPIDASQVACKLLSASDRSTLAGTPVDDIVSASGTAGSSQCRWQAESALIQVTTLPAKEWAKSLPDIVRQLESSTDISSPSDKADLAKAKKLLSGAATFTDDQACDAFTTLAELGGGRKGATTTITTIPITQTESGISGQACSGGDLMAVLYSIPGLKETKDVDADVTAILGRAQKRLAKTR